MTNFFLENNRCESIILDVAVLKLYYISGHVHLGKHNFPNQDRTFRGIESNVPRMISISLFSFFLCLFRFVAKNRIIARQIEWYQSQYCRDNAIVRYEVLEFSSLPPRLHHPTPFHRDRFRSDVSTKTTYRWLPRENQFQRRKKIILYRVIYVTYTSRITFMHLMKNC